MSRTEKIDYDIRMYLLWLANKTKTSTKLTWGKGDLLFNTMHVDCITSKLPLKWENYLYTDEFMLKRNNFRCQRCLQMRFPHECRFLSFPLNSCPLDECHNISYALLTMKPSAFREVTSDDKLQKLKFY
ncbi:CLUMA_CG008627, isoform A [Clunio marinus]|uniref:CLUMA_CG008627, isoform A n=1 Tax=Clunio marinus TaxID=568069 RepID=A0A1J1I876_9DIPT|nr:CLUMA_CG008627, isoform A [Clunio marinus]